jgi:DNA-binding protein H-NS
MAVPIVIQHREVLKVARQLAMSTVIAWFGNLSFDQQKDALGQMQGEHEQSRSAKRAELVTQLAALGYAVPKKRGRPPAKANPNGAAARKGRRIKVKAKYRDPKTKETWSGRGRMASWLKSKQDGGENIEKYLV